MSHPNSIDALKLHQGEYPSRINIVVGKSVLSVDVPLKELRHQTIQNALRIFAGMEERKLFTDSKYHLAEEIRLDPAILLEVIDDGSG